MALNIRFSVLIAKISLWFDDVKRSPLEAGYKHIDSFPFHI